MGVGHRTNSFNDPLKEDIKNKKNHTYVSSVSHTQS